MTTKKAKPTPRTNVQAAAQRNIPTYDSAIAHNSASFNDIAELFYNRLERFNPNPVIRLVYERYYTPLLKAFEAAHGAIYKSHFCTNITAAAVFTEKDEIYIVFSQRGAETDEIEGLLFECDRLHVEAHRLLKGPDRRACMEIIYSPITYLLAMVDAKPNESRSSHGASSYSTKLTRLKGELARAEAYYVRSAQLNAQLYYFYGMLWGVLPLAFLGLVVGLALPVGFLLHSLIAGGLGAIVSVMSRMTFGRLVLNYEAGRRMLLLLGGFRPIIGSVFGVALYFLVASGLLPIAVPDDAAKHLYFYPGIAFLAGFSERWAQDMLVQSRRRITASAGEEDRKPAEEKATSAPVAPK